MEQAKDMPVQLVTPPLPKPTQPDPARRFWMIKGPGGAPNMMYQDPAKAQAEAERLANKNPGGRFFLMETVGYVVAAPPTPGPTSWLKVVGHDEGGSHGSTHPLT